MADAQPSVESLLSKQDIPTTALPDQLKTLERRSLLAKAGHNDWVVHAIVKDFLQVIIEKQNKKENLNRLAAEYYESNAPVGIRQLSDVDFLVEAVYHYEKANCEDRHESIFIRLSTVLQNIGYSHYMKGVYSEAEKALELRMKSEPDEKAIQLFEYALKINPRDAITLQSYAICLKEKGEHKKAIQRFEEALKIDMDPARKAITLQAYAICLKEKGEYERAIQRFEEAQKINPKDAVTLQAYAICLKEKGEHEKAVQRFEEALKIDTNPAQKAITLQAYAICLKEMKEYKPAILHLEKAIEIQRDSVVILQEYAICLCRLGRFEEADKLFCKIPDDNLDAIAKTEWARTKMQLARKDKNARDFHYKEARSILQHIQPKDSASTGTASLDAAFSKTSASPARPPW